MGFVLDEEARTVNKSRYLRDNFSKMSTFLLKFFISYAKIMKRFVKFFENDFKLKADIKYLSKYADYGVEYMCELCLKHLTTFIKSRAKCSFEEYLLLRHNLYQIEKNVLPSQVKEKFYFRKELSDSFSNLKNIIYERTITQINDDIEFCLSGFLLSNFKKKNIPQKQPEHLTRTVAPLVVN